MEAVGIELGWPRAQREANLWPFEGYCSSCEELDRLVPHPGSRTDDNDQWFASCWAQHFRLQKAETRAISNEDRKAARDVLAELIDTTKK